MDDSALTQVKRISPIVWLVSVFAALAIFYSLIIPLFEGPDEDDHFRYVKFISDYRALPVQSLGLGGGEAGHQGWQPPLYYSLAAILISPINTFDFPAHLLRNPYATIVGDPTCCGRNLYTHLENENFPYTGTSLAVHLVRLLSVFFGAITVGATYILTKTIFPNQSLLTLAVASIVAFNPSFIFISALVSNDGALAAFSSLVLLLWVKLIYGNLDLNFKSAAMLSVFIGLGTLTKLTAIGLVPLTILLFAILAWRKRNINLFFLSFLVCSFAFALVSGWWIVRNQILYDDPLAVRVAAISALFPRTGELTVAELFQISLPQFWNTFWGGPTPSDFSPLILIILAILTALAIIGIILAFIRISNFDFRISILFLTTWLGLLFAAMIQLIRITQGGDQGRYLFPAISVFALFFVLGLDEFVARSNAYLKSRITSLHFPFTFSLSSFPNLSISKSLNFSLQSLNLSFSHFLILFFFVLALFVPFAYTLPAYGHPELLSRQDLARFSNTTPTNFANQIELLGYELGAHSVKPGESLRVTLYWRALAPMPASYRIFVHLVGQKDASAGGVEAIPARGGFPTYLWKPEDAIRDTYQLPITTDALPGKYFLEVGLYPIGKPGERLMVSGSGDDRVLLAFVKIAPTQPAVYTPSTPINAIFAEQAELIGYDTIAEQNKIRLVLYWRAKKPMDRDYAVFVHALDASGKIITQMDRQPQEGNYPTSIWDVGEQVRDEYLLNIPASAYRIAVGLYRADTGERLPVATQSGLADHLEFSLGNTP